MLSDCLTFKLRKRIPPADFRAQQLLFLNPEQYAIGHKSLLRCPHQKPRLREKSIDSASVDNAWRNGPDAIPQARTASAEPGAIALLRNALGVQMHRR